MNVSGPSWYDVLDIEEDASADEVRAAWKAAIADLDPTDRRFRMLNQAAEVLLDSDRRASYDAGLAPVDQPVDQPVDPRDDKKEVAGPAAASVETTGDETWGPSEPSPVPVDSDLGAEVSLEKPQGTEPDLSESIDDAPADPAPAAGAGAGTGGVFTWPVLVLSMVAVLLVSVTVLATVQLRDSGGSAGASAEVDQVEAARTVAQQAVVPILSYDYRSLDEDRAAAQSYMSDDYAEEYDRYFSAAVEANAPRTETVVDVTVLSSGIVRTGDDRVDVLLFVDRPTTNTQTPEPVVYKDQVTLQMVNVDGDWLVDDLVTSLPAPG